MCPVREEEEDREGDEEEVEQEERRETDIFNEKEEGDMRMATWKGNKQYLALTGALSKSLMRRNITQSRTTNNNNTEQLKEKDGSFALF